MKNDFKTFDSMYKGIVNNQVFCREFEDDRKLTAINLETGKSFSILPEDYYLILEHINSQEYNED